ncbi:imm11 family protein [Shewanella woodyi]|uniref:imm11 family protein n=1 Tax=Shewanella woodyi TaxID=60961 RepID=UPI0012F975C7|nr:DUF1629 domain-containing protein [Shewanella woodyi]
MANERNSENELSIDDTPLLIETNGWEFDSGLYIKETVPLISHTYKLEPEQFITDYIVAYGFKGLLFSKKLLKVMKDLKVNNVQCFPVELVNGDTEQIDEYSLINVIGQYCIVDHERSEVTSDDDGDIQFIDSLTFIDTSKVELPPIFRLSSFLPLVIVNNQIKQAFEDNNITGLKFYKPEEFSL